MHIYEASLVLLLPMVLKELVVNHGRGGMVGGPASTPTNHPGSTNHSLLHEQRVWI